MILFPFLSNAQRMGTKEWKNKKSLHTHTQTIIIMLYMLSYPKKEEGREREGGGKQVKTLEFLLFWGDL